MTQPTIDLRLGDWRDVLADVGEVDAVITDPPYGERTHAGNQGMHDRFGSAARRDLEYASMSPDSAAGMVAFWAPRCRGWIAAMTSDDLISVYRASYESAGLYAFAPVVIRQPRVRLVGDGPASEAVYLMVARPRKRRFLSWGALPGWYDASIDRSGVQGGKPISLMRAIVRDYSMPGDVIIDPFAGGGTTLLAARAEGRSCIGAEIDPETHARAMRRLAQPWTRELFA